MFTKICVCTVVFLLLTACAAPAVPSTSTIIPTLTPTPPAPTATLTPTPEPTDTPEPTATPESVGPRTMTVTLPLNRFDENSTETKDIIGFFGPTSDQSGKDGMLASEQEQELVQFAFDNIIADGVLWGNDGKGNNPIPEGYDAQKFWDEVILIPGYGDNGSMAISVSASLDSALKDSFRVQLVSVLIDNKELTLVTYKNSQGYFEVRIIELAIEKVSNLLIYKQIIVPLEAPETISTS